MTSRGRLVTNCKLCIPWCVIRNLSKRYLLSKCHKVSWQKCNFMPSYVRKNTRSFSWPIFTEPRLFKHIYGAPHDFLSKWILGLLSLSAKAAGAWSW